MKDMKGKNIKQNNPSMYGSCAGEGNTRNGATESDKTLSYLIFITQRRIYTSNEIRERIKNRGITNEDSVEHYISELTRRGLLDDRMFVKLNIEGYLHRGYGTRHIMDFFKRRMIDVDIECIDKDLELEYLIDYLKEKYFDKILSQKDYDKLKNRVLRRGYSARTTMKAMNAVGFKIDYNIKDEVDKMEVERKIHQLISKGYGCKYIEKYIYSKYKQKENIRYHYSTEKETETLGLYVEKKQLSNNQKSTQHLLQRGFPYSLIKKALQ